MRCIFCEVEETKVVDSRFVGEINQIRRRRSCSNCQKRFWTHETAELSLPKVIKNNGDVVNFDEDKIREGILRAIEKRPVTIERIEQSVARIINNIREMGREQMPSLLIGEIVMDELCTLDQVAYIRFASVYRSFDDIGAFRKEIERLQIQGAE